MINQIANTITDRDAIRSVNETRKALKVPLALELLTAAGLALMANHL